MAAAIPITDQIDGVAFLRERLAAELARGRAGANAADLAQMQVAIGRVDAALATLRWLARDRDGCVRFLTTKLAG